jgi:hypothetical protein
MVKETCPVLHPLKLELITHKKDGKKRKENRSCTVIQLQLCLYSCSEVTLKLYLQLQCSYFHMFAKVFWDMKLCILIHRYENLEELPGISGQKTAILSFTGITTSNHIARFVYIVYVSSSIIFNFCNTRGTHTLYDVQILKWVA